MFWLGLSKYAFDPAMYSVGSTETGAAGAAGGGAITVLVFVRTRDLCTRVFAWTCLVAVFVLGGGVACDRVSVDRPCRPQRPRLTVLGDS